MTNIDKDFWFIPNTKLTITDVSNALNSYKSNFESAFKLERQFIIFLDTNILLAYYGMHKNQQEKLIRFLIFEKDRIYITHQIEKEFIRNRASTIRKNSAAFEKLKQEIREDLDKIDKSFEEIEKGFRTLKEKVKQRLNKNFPKSWRKLAKTESLNFDKLFNKSEFLSELNNEISNLQKNYKEIIFEDTFLEQLSKLNKIDELSEEEERFITQKYTELLNKYKKSNSNSHYAFPGCGEDKPISPEGDFIIYHEMLKCIKDKNVDIVFLTLDSTKEDWIKKDKTAIMHYLYYTYKNTNHHMFILNAEGINDISYEQVSIDQIDLKFEIRRLEQEQADVDRQIWRTEEYLKTDNLTQEVISQSLQNIENKKIEKERIVNEIIELKKGLK